MKLNPPGSSSDLEVARAIARRLHQRARGSDAAPDAAPSPAHERPAPPGPGPSSAGTPSIPPDALEPEPVLTPEPPELEATPPVLEPEPPELSVPEEATPPTGPKPFEPELPDGYEADTGAFKAGSPEAPPVVEETPFEPEPPGGYTIEDTGGVFEPELPGAGPEEPSWGGDESGVSADAIGGNAALEDLDVPGAPGLSPEDLISNELPADGGVSPDDLLGDQPPAAPGFDEPSPIEAEVASPGGVAPEDMVAVPEQSWDDVADSCLAIAPAHGAMLVDPAGQVLTARGEWPEPGPEAIAGRLVSMMDKKLRDAPTRSVSAPLAGLHLTAWRVPANDGYLTVVFMAEAPLRADVRPAIDTTIQAAGG
jgi:hypothetical protein